MSILAIDPGPEVSGWCIWAMSQPVAFGVDDNEKVLDWLRLNFCEVDTVVIEKVEGFGMAVGASVFETVYLSGQMAEAARQSGIAVERIGRKAIKVHICGTVKAKDANIHAAIADRYGGSLKAAKGVKANPGPLYGIRSHAWSALAVAIAWSEGAR